MRVKCVESQVPGSPPGYLFYTEDHSLAHKTTDPASVRVLRDMMQGAKEVFLLARFQGGKLDIAGVCTPGNW